MRGASGAIACAVARNAWSDARSAAGEELDEIAIWLHSSCAQESGACIRVAYVRCEDACCPVTRCAGVSGGAISSFAGPPSEAMLIPSGMAIAADTASVLLGGPGASCMGHPAWSISIEQERSQADAYEDIPASNSAIAAASMFRILTGRLYAHLISSWILDIAISY